METDLTIEPRKLIKTPADNERFHASGGVCPQKHLYKFASASPARTFVKPAASLCVSSESAVEKQHVLKRIVQSDNVARQIA